VNDGREIRCMDVLGKLQDDGSGDILSHTASKGCVARLSQGEGDLSRVPSEEHLFSVRHRSS
jgi:hypothetical protein